MSRSENIKLALNSFLYTEKRHISRTGAFYKVGEHDVHITNVPVCTCSDFNYNFFCKHVYNILLFKFKVNVRNKILYTNIWTDEQLRNILRKRYRQPSRPRQNRPRSIPRRRNIRESVDIPTDVEIAQVSGALVQHARRQRNNPRRLRRDRRQLERRRAIYIPPLEIPRQRNYSNSEPPEAPRNRIPHPPSFNSRRPLGFVISPNRLRRLRNEEYICHMNINNEYNPDEDLCSICIEKLDNSTNVITMCSQCSNHFHDTCIDTWIMHRLRSRPPRPPSCPLCRSIIDM